MNNSVLHKANSRGHANHGWLDSYHTFSFGNYHNPQRMGFGAMRVLNDDTVSSGMGFAKHPHRDMEIISIPLEGDLEHKDSMGNVATIRKGDVQAMSAGTGIEHSEFNKNRDKLVKFLQIWIYPREKNVSPRYDQLSLKLEDRNNKLQQILSPNADDAGVWIQQDAWFHIGKFENGFSSNYQLKKEGNGVYFFVLDGDFDVNGTALETRDGLGIWNENSFDIKSKSDNAEMLIIEVPMWNKGVGGQFTKHYENICITNHFDIFNLECVWASWFAAI